MAWQVDLCFFNEPTVEQSLVEEDPEREWGEFEYVRMHIPTEDDAVEYARHLAYDKRADLEAIRGLLGYDGLSVDVRMMADPEPHAYVHSYEVVPGMKVDEWHYEECHEGME